MKTEKNLIDANKLNVCYINTGTVMFPKMEAYVRVDDIVNAQIVDAVEVVRCVDCDYYGDDHCLRSHGGGSYVPFPMKPDDFCSYGKKQ